MNSFNFVDKNTSHLPEKKSILLGDNLYDNLKEIGQGNLNL